MSDKSEIIFQNDNCKSERLQLVSGQTLYIAAGVESQVGDLTLGDDCVIYIDGGRLVVSRLSAGANFNISGSGSITVLESMICGEGSSLELSKISLVLSGATVELSGESSVELDKFPIIDGTLISKGRTTIKAECRNIFRNTVFEGKIKADKAYPEWFAEEQPEDWAPLINRALQLSEDGTTYLQCKVYSVSSTIYLPANGRLLGTPSGVSKVIEGQGDNKDNYYFGTMLEPSGTAFDKSCIIAVNINQSELQNTKLAKEQLPNAKNLADKEFLTPGAEIGYIRIQYWKTENFYTGILIAYTGYIHDVVFQNMSRSILWTRNYADQKKVTRCVVKDILRDTTLSNPESVYAIDFNSLGDALIFEGNAIHGTNRDATNVSAKGLKLNHCLGGIVTSNVINADTYISGCKGITFSNNHMEYGAQVIIKNSEVNVFGNYLEKGLRPSVVVDSGDDYNAAVVNFSGNTYVYLSNASRTKIAPSADDSGHLDYRSASVSEICDYDLLVSGTSSGTSAIINICNDLRYWSKNGDPGRLYPVGISVYQEIRDKSLSCVDSFKWRSHLLSRSSSLIFTPSLKASFPSVTVSELNSPYIEIWGVNSNTPWFEETGSVKYYYQIVWDYNQQIISARKDAKVKSTEGISPVKGGSGVLISAFGASTGCGNQWMIRVFRELTYVNAEGKQVKKYSYADVPIVGSRVLFDDGHAIATYEWQDASAISQVELAGNINTSRITYVGDQLILS